MFVSFIFALLQYRGNQKVTLKVKIPTKITPRQKELIEEFSNPNAASTKSSSGDSSTSSTGGSTSSSGSTAQSENCNSSFTIEQAWKRVKDYWSSTKKDTATATDSTKASDSATSASAKAKAKKAAAEEQAASASV